MQGHRLSYLAIPAHASQIIAPVALVWSNRLDPGGARKALEALLRAAVGVTFLAHGWEALQWHPRFIDYVVTASELFTGDAVSDATATSVVTVIGLQDLVLAALVLAGIRWRFLLIWMALWATLAAGARVVFGGWARYPAVFVRAANGGLPLTLLWVHFRVDMSRTNALIPVSLLPILLAGLAGLSTLALPGTVSAETSGPQHPRVVWLEDPAHRATIVWHTQGSQADVHRVRWGRADGTKSPLPLATNAVRHIDERLDHATFHHAVLSDLQPATRYRFQVESGGQRSETYTFETAPDDNRPVTLLYGGDSRSNREGRRRVNRQIRRMVEDDDARIVAMLHGGDYVEHAMVWEDWDAWLDDWDLTHGSDGELLPVIPARGNHEFSPHQTDPNTPDNYNAVWGQPAGPSRDYWTTRIGSHIGIVTLDTNAPVAGDQRDWLADQLKQLTETRRWVVANYHRPAYPAVKRPGAAQQHWVPLFEKYGVDLVCESDGHVLKRTVPIMDGKRDPDGVVYVGEGGLGVAQRTPDTDRWYLQPPGMAKSAHHIQKLTFKGDTLTYRAVGLDGEVLDTYERPARRPPVEPEPSEPAEATQPATSRRLPADAVMENAPATESSRQASSILEYRDIFSLLVVCITFAGAVIWRRRNGQNSQD
jgi:hypothetical protein